MRTCVHNLHLIDEVDKVLDCKPSKRNGIGGQIVLFDRAECVHHVHYIATKSWFGTTLLETVEARHPRYLFRGDVASFLHIQLQESVTDKLQYSKRD